jgi:hypothetical protein
VEVDTDCTRRLDVVSKLGRVPIAAVCVPMQLFQETRPWIV